MTEAGKAYEQADYAKAEKLLQAALKEAEKFGEEDPRLATGLNCLALLYQAQGKYAQAEPLHRRALAISEKALGPEHLDVALNVELNAALLRKMGHNAEAEKLEARARAKRPALDRLLRDTRQGRFDVVLVWASDRLARSTRHFLEVVDELTHLNIEFVSFREQLDTGGPLGRAVTVIIGAIAELERNLIIERVKAGLRRAKIEGRRLGRPPLAIDRAALLRDRQRGMTLTELAKAHGISRGSVSRVLRQAKTDGTKTCPQARLQAVESTEAKAAD